MAEAKKLEIGDKYLSISVLGQIKLAAFKNKDKKSAKSPDYIGQGVAVWINEKKAQQPENRGDL
jgi:hypothetical protein